MHTIQSKRAQGTIEYLVIIAIVVVISLVVVGLLVSMVGQDTSSVGSTSQDLKLKSSSVSVDSLVASTDGNALIVLSNILGDRITVKKVTVDGVDHTFGSAGPLVTGGKQTLDLNNVPPCTLGEKKNYAIKINYESVNGITQVVDLGNVNVTCSATANAIGNVVKEGTVVVPGGGGTQGSNVTITLTNNESSATGANFQQMIVFNPSDAAYAPHEAADLGNIRFYDGATELYSWCESGCTSSSGSAIFWVKLPNGVAGNDGTATITMKFLATNVGYDATFAGQAPQLSQTLGGTVPTSGLVGYWHLNGDATDASGNGNDGTVNGTTSYDQGGVIGSAMSFDGSTYIESNNNGLVGASELTQAAWIKMSNGAGCPISGGDGPGGTRYYQMCLVPQGNYMEFYSNSTGEPTMGLPVTINDNTWHHVAETFSSDGTVGFYVDGGLIGTVSTGQSLSIGSGVNHIGDDMGFGGIFTGLIDEAAVWNRALSSTEISELYSTGYATHDNGASVFNFYENFVGTSQPAGWVDWPVQGYCSDMAFNNGLFTNNGSANPGCQAPGTFDDTTTTLDVFANGTSYGFWGFVRNSNNGYLGINPNSDTGYWGFRDPSAQSSVPLGSDKSVFTTWGDPNSGNGYLQANYSTVATTSGVDFDSSIPLVVWNTGGFIQWMRTRTTPPNGIMPTVSGLYLMTT